MVPTLNNKDADCTCGRIAVGMTVTDTRNWHPDCAEHGTASVWWNSKEQQAARAARREQLIGLQRRAREARRAAARASQ
ncbi:hypothetical protein GCM10010317_076620 [Streptomyces mirabilis]|nr:hypothetical protein GCM10010317_076620 [Streptomyces mirabilis]